MEINSVIEKNTTTIKLNSDAAVQQKMNIGNYKSALEGLPGPLGSAATAVTSFGATLKALLLNPIALAITAIAGTLYGLFKIFTSGFFFRYKIRIILR